MNPSRLFIERPVATALLMVAILLAGIVAYRQLPLSALPQVDYPTIQVVTLYPGASPDVVTSSITAPLERQFGQMPGLKQMSSTSSGGASVITLQFDLTMKLDVAEQQVQAAINAGSNLLPTDLPAPPIYSKVNPADAPILTLGDHVDDAEDAAGAEPRRHAARAEDLAGAGRGPGVALGRAAARGARAGEPEGARRAGPRRWRTCAPRSTPRTRTRPRAASTARRAPTPSTPTTSCSSAEEYRKVVVAYRNGAPIYLSDVADVIEDAENATPRRVDERHARPSS